jgi:hypothetical protein
MGFLETLSEENIAKRLLKKTRVDGNLEILSEENVSRRLSKRRKGCRKTL